MKIKKYFFVFISLIMIFSGALGCEASYIVPFKEHILPGTVNISDFDIGGRGITYEYTQGINEGTVNYRDDVKLNFWPLGSEVIVGTAPRCWYSYTVNADKKGIYQISVRGASIAFSECEVIVDNKITLNGELEASGSYQVAGTYVIGEVNLEKGLHTIKYKHQSGSSNLYSIIFKYMGEKSNVDLKLKNGPYRNFYLPTLIEAEDFDLDNYKSNDGVNSFGKYRKDAHIDIGETKAEDKKTYLFLNKEEYVTYTFNVDNAGTYCLYTNACDDGQATFFIDNDKVASKVDFKASDETTTQKVFNVNLSKGIHKMRVFCENSSLSVDYFKFLRTNEKADTKDEENNNNNKNVGKIYKNLYVSTKGSDDNDGDIDKPFLTLKKAISEISLINKNMTGNIVVHIEPGTYFIDETLVIDENSGGQNGYKVVITGDDIFNKPIISGGEKINEWKKIENSPIYVADTNAEDTRTLYVNDFPATVAKSKYTYTGLSDYHIPGSLYGSDGVVVSKVNFPKKFSRPDQIMLGWNILWTHQETPVKEIIETDKEFIFSMVQPYWSTYSSFGGSHLLINSTKEFFIENAIEVLDEPGEFYFDKKDKKMYYYPYKEEDMKTADTYVGVTEKLLYVGGSDPQHKNANIELNNISFKYGALNEINKRGVKFNQADERHLPNSKMDYYISEMFPAQITVNNCENIEIKNCTFSCLGSNALNMDNGVKNAKVIGNVFKDISGTGMVVGHFQHTNYLSKEQDRVENVEIANNVFRRTACEFIGTTAIASYHPKNVNIHNNDIKDNPYTGITLGWGWGADVKENTGIYVHHNRIEDVMQLTHDGAHIYTLSSMKDSSINDNYLIDSRDHRGGIYYDEGTKDIVARHNVIEQCYQWLFARKGVGLNNLLVEDNFSDTARMEQDTDHVTVKGTTVYNYGNPPKEALEIMNNAGLEAGFTRLLKDTSYPKWRIIPYKRNPNGQFAIENQFNVNRWVLGKEYDNFHEISGKRPEVYAGGEIGDTKPGEWVEFNINLPKNASYELSIRGGDGWSTDAPKCTAKLEFDGEVIGENILIPRDSWKLTDVRVGKFELTKGKHTFRIYVMGNDWLVGGFKFDDGTLIDDSISYDEGKIITEEELKDKNAEFADIDGNFAAYEIRQLNKSGIINGYDKNTFAPNDNVSLYEACMLTLRAMKKYDKDWKKAASEFGFLKFENEADCDISRERFIHIVMTAYKNVFGKFSITIDEKNFKDNDSVSSEYINDIYGAKELNFIKGYQDNTIRPKNTLTRAEAAKIIDSLYNELK